MTTDDVDVRTLSAVRPISAIGRDYPVVRIHQDPAAWQLLEQGHELSGCSSSLVHRAACQIWQWSVGSMSSLAATRLSWIAAAMCPGD
jgi:hypothetical protein